MTEARARFFKDRDAVAQFMRDGRLDDAAHTLLVTMRPSQRAFFAAIAELTEYQSSIMVSEGQAARDDGRVAITITLVVAGLAAAVAVVMAVAITRGLTRQLGAEPGEVVAIASAIADGDLAVEVHTRAGDTSSLAGRHAAHARVAWPRSWARCALQRLIATGSSEIATRQRGPVPAHRAAGQHLQQTAASMEELTATVQAPTPTPPARPTSWPASAPPMRPSAAALVVGQVVRTMDGHHRRPARRSPTSSA